MGVPRVLISGHAIHEIMLNFNVQLHITRSEFNPLHLVMADLSTYLPLTRESVQKAHEIVQKHVHLTPVLTNTTLNNLASTPQSAEALKGTEFEGHEPAKPKIRFFFKCENFQRIGAFKVRGAFHAISRLPEEVRRKGVVTHSSGVFLNGLRFLSAIWLTSVQETMHKQLR